MKLFCFVVIGWSTADQPCFFSCTGSDLVEAEKTGIKIVESPYVVSFKDIPKYFKPGLPFDFTVRTTLCVQDLSTTPAYFLCFMYFVQCLVLTISPTCSDPGEPPRRLPAP